MIAPAVENGSIEFLLESYWPYLAQKESLERMRQKAWNQYKALGFPSHLHEAYRYIKLSHLGLQRFCLLTDPPVDLEQDQLNKMIYPECQNSALVFINGQFSLKNSRIDALPPEILITSLVEAMDGFGPLLNNHWNKSLKEESDPFAASNAAMHQQGAFVYIPPKCQIDVPIQILHIITSSTHPPLLMPRIQLFVGSQAQVKLIQTQKSLAEEGAAKLAAFDDSMVKAFDEEEDVSDLSQCVPRKVESFAIPSEGYFVNQVTEIAIEEAAEVHFIQALHDEHPQGFHFDAFRATLKRDSRLKTVAVSKGSATVRHDYKVKLVGENGEALLNGIWMLDHKNEFHSNVLIEHQAPHCRSHQLFKGVLTGTSRSSFEGKILVQKAAQKTEAFQLNNNLLLQDYAQAFSKPNLEIFADDVKASHGATIGQLDKEQIFYLNARGLSSKEAKALLIKGFCAEVIEMIDLESLSSILQKAFNFQSD